MNSGFEIAKVYWDGGLNCLPIVPKRKCPSCDWQVFTEHRITLGELEALFKHAIGNGPGLCVVCGEVSGNLEIVDIDIPTLVEPFLEKLRQLPCFDLLVLERTPRGGLHVIYRCDTIEHSQDLAKGPNPDNPEKMQGWIHTRGEGSICLIAPTSAYYHDMEDPTGDYRLVQGDLANVHTISPDLRKDILEIARSFNRAPKKQPAPKYDYTPSMSYASNVWLEAITWSWLLKNKGWRELDSVGKETYWQRPGKEGSGHSATVGYMGYDMFYNFSNSAPPFEPNKGYSKFSVFALLYHDGDRSKARKALNKLAVKANQKGKQKVYARAPDLAFVTELAWNGLLKVNKKKEKYFRFANEFVRLETADMGKPFFRLIKLPEVTYETAKTIWWYDIMNVAEKKGDEPIWEEYQCRPDKDILVNMLATPDKQLPVITRIVEVPVYGPDGGIEFGPGYHRASMTYCKPPADLVLPTLADVEPTAKNVVWAKALLEEVVCDFPFTSAADRINALSFPFVPLVREIIGGSVPAYVFDAPAQGTGKTLLMMVLLRPTQGRNISTTTLDEKEDELKKVIISKLVAGVSVIIYDNVKHKVSSAKLEEVLTSTSTSGRWLGHSKDLVFPVRQLFVLTGNHIEVSKEIARRTCWIRQDARLEHPQLRKASEFKHPRLREWCDGKRSDILKAMYIIIQNWIINHKMKPGKAYLGMFERWAAVMSGIMESVGWTEFECDELAAFEDIDEEREPKLKFLANWYDNYSTRPVAADKLLSRAIGAGLVHKDTTNAGFGKILFHMKGDVVGPYRICRGKKNSYTMAWTWYLKKKGDKGGKPADQQVVEDLEDQFDSMV